MVSYGSSYYESEGFEKEVIMVAGVEERGKLEQRVRRVRAGMELRFNELHTLFVLLAFERRDEMCREKWQTNVEFSPLPHRMLVPTNKPSTHKSVGHITSFRILL